MKLIIKLSLISGLMISTYSFADDMSTTDQQSIAQNAQSTQENKDDVIPTRSETACNT